MSFGQRMRQRREELGMSRAELARSLGVSLSAVGNYETDLNAMRSELLPRLFHALQVDPNYLYQDYFLGSGFRLDGHEQALVEKYRSLTLAGRRTVESVLGALCDYQADMEKLSEPAEVREIPLYRSPAAAGFASPVFGADYDMIPVTAEVPRAAEFAVRIQGDSMEPCLHDGGVAYVSRSALAGGDVGIFCVDGEMLCKQYYRDRLGMVYLYSINRARSDADVLLAPSGGRSMVCFGKVLLSHVPPVPGL